MITGPVLEVADYPQELMVLQCSMQTSTAQANKQVDRRCS